MKPGLYKVTGGTLAGAMVYLHFMNVSGNADCRLAEPFDPFEVGTIIVVAPHNLVPANQGTNIPERGTMCNHEWNLKAIGELIESLEPTEAITMVLIAKPTDDIRIMNMVEIEPLYLARTLRQLAQQLEDQERDKRAKEAASRNEP